MPKRPDPERQRRVGILTSHPIQVQAPLFRTLAARSDIDLTVYFGSRQGVSGSVDPQFGIPVKWDIPLLEGYRHQFLSNLSRRPDVNRYGGIDTPEIADVIAHGHFDAFVVMGWYLKSHWQAIRACWATRTPLLVRGVAYLDMPRRVWPIRLLKRWRLRRLFRRCDALLTTGRQNEAFYAHFGADPARFVRAPHAVDNVRFRLAAAHARVNRQALRRHWRLDPSACVFLFSGKLIAKKRPQDAIRALAQLPDRAGAALLVVGDGEWRSRCEALARKLAPRRVRFAGFLNQSRMPEAYAAADVLVMPSDRGETWGLAVNEAMACGLPAVVSDRVGCAADLVVPGRTGFVVPAGDVNALADAMAGLAYSARFRRRMAGEAVRHVDNYGIPQAAAGFVRAIHWVGTADRDQGPVREARAA